ncbi:MAG: hypothetical protein ACYC0H_10105 [Solirubrobacteraceae bacterium]
MSTTRRALLLVAVLAFAAVLLAFENSGPATREASGSAAGRRTAAARQAPSLMRGAERRVALRFTCSFLAFAYGGRRAIKDATPALAQRLLRDPRRGAPAAAERHPRVLSLTVLAAVSGRPVVLARIGWGILRYRLRVGLLVRRHGAPIVDALEGGV